VSPSAIDQATSPRTPRAAAAAGVLFAGLYGAALVLIRLALPRGAVDSAAWRADPSALVSVALHMVAFGGIAFLWFMGVVRVRIGRREDRFLATVFMGSGLLFLAMTFVACAITAALLQSREAMLQGAEVQPGFMVGARVVYELTNIYSVRMAGVFMISLATLCLRTGALPRRLAFGTYALASVLLLGIAQTLWATLLFPIWVLALSLYLLVNGLDPQPGGAPQRISSPP
jgi:hypothetical protein